MICRYCSKSLRKAKARRNHEFNCPKRPLAKTMSEEEQKARDALFARHPDYMPKSPNKGYEPHLVQG
jgi:hypothetical protein